MRLQVWTYCEQRRAGQLAKAVAPLLTVEGMRRTKRIGAKHITAALAMSEACVSRYRKLTVSWLTSYNHASAPSMTGH